MSPPYLYWFRVVRRGPTRSAGCGGDAAGAEKNERGEKLIGNGKRFRRTLMLHLHATRTMKMTTRFS